ncbi:platelet endothelial cell adhesion molecule-like isoform X3 [Betta splendens]|uniref:Platelet endothelial cell adhesion molecule-like isoform X3 n=1 Tax=Betta splendens TaxID=158456 RepID=A0A6P7MHQ0_BETSP|nr:platelet endothelial cell adhesion molecule-like isoform X3 [Betta splendens]XP_029013450.1 platelet endothelial cell adhesion molecule-like isoform X3 [Betta splendens]
MGLLLLLTCSLLSSCSVVHAQRKFTIRSVELFIEPHVNVTRGTNVTVRCRALVSSLDQEPLSREYVIYKDNKNVYTKTSITPEDLLYPLPHARVANTGNYRCGITIEGKRIKSEDKKLTVTGLSKPVLRLNNTEVTEGDEVTAKCEAPGETGSIFFSFYEGSKVITESGVNGNQLEAQLPLSSTGTHTLHCTYVVFIMQDLFKSEESDAVHVTVREFTSTPVLEIYPLSDVYEGDRLNLLCTIRNPLLDSKSGYLYLSQGMTMLTAGVSAVNYTVVAKSHVPAEFECRFEMGRIEKVTTKQIAVTELFSVPKLTISPAEVFQGDNITLTCRSEIYVPGRINNRDLIYSLSSFREGFTKMSPGVFSGRTLPYEFNYTCAAQARGVLKESQILTVLPKVSVSAPEISVLGLPVVGRTFQILCHSAVGSLPISYTLLKNGVPLKPFRVTLPWQKATFPVSISSPQEINSYRCQAKNRNEVEQHSNSLNATVIVPLTKPTLFTHPNLTQTYLYEGNELLLICEVTGSPPVTYQWYRGGRRLTSASNLSSVGYHFQRLSKEDGGSYHCEAGNEASVVRSEALTVEVYTAIWKQALIVGACVLLPAALVLGCVLYFKSKRGKREAAAELSVTEVSNAATAGLDGAVVSVWTERPPDAGDDDVSNVVPPDPDVEYTEVVHPHSMDPARVPLRKGTDTVYSELKNAPHGAADHHDYGSLEYAGLNGEQPEVGHCSPEVNGYHDLPEPVD